MNILRQISQRTRRSLRVLPAIHLVWQSSPSWTAARGVLLVLLGVLPLASIYLAKLIVDAITNGISINIAPSTAIKPLIPLIVVTSLIMLVTVLATSLSELVNTAQTQKVSDYMRRILHQKSIEVDLEYYENPRYHDILQRAQQEITYRPNQILTRLAQVVQNAILLIGIIGLLLTLHWGLAGVLIISSIPAVLVRVGYTKELYRWQRDWTPIERQSMYLSLLLTNEQFAKEIRLFGLGQMFSQRFDRLRQSLYQAKLGLIARRSVFFFLAQVFAGIFVFAVYGYIIFQTLQGNLNLGDLVLYHQALQRGQSSLKTLTSSLSGLYEDNLFLSNLYEFLDLKPQIVTPAHPKFFPPVIEKGIVFDHVSFQYDNTTRQALKDVSLVVRPGETIALVGENGSGKTTLIKLLSRLYDPTDGQITVDGIDLRDLDITQLRKKISVIFQDYAKYYFSAQDNIWMGNIDIPPDHRAVVEAAKRSGAHEVLTNLPDGYNTMLGKLFNGGEELSIGQWQKVALARAFLRESQVIVLDEPTSAMDPKSEYEVFKRFRELIQDQAAILITHRLSTVKMADRIYVMEQGRIVESGCHDKLMDKQGLYANLFETQARNYR